MIGRKERKPLITSPQTNKLSRQQSSPTKATVLLQADTSQYINSLKAKKQNYSTSLDLYQACYENQLPQKCLKHLNFITLYCQNKNKLLCVNCLYGSTLYKNDRVIPSNSATVAIATDNEQNLKFLQEQLQNIREAQSRVNENKRNLENGKNHIMKQIDNYFVEIYKMVQFKHQQLKDQAIKNFSKAIQQNETSQKQINWWKNQIQQAKSHLPREGRGQEAQLYKHLVLELMLNERLEAQKLTYQASAEQMEDEFLSQAKQLKQAVRRKISQKQMDNRNSRRIKLF